MRCVVYLKESCHTCMDESEVCMWVSRIHMCDMNHLYAWHDPFIGVAWRIHMCDMTHSCVWHDSFMCVTWLIHMCDMTHSYVRHDSFMCVTWLVHVCVTQACQVSRMDESCHAYEGVTSHVWRSYVTHSSKSEVCMFVSRRRVKSHIWMSHVIHEGVMSHMYGWVMPCKRRSHVTCMDESRHTYEGIMTHMWMNHVTHVNESCHACKIDFTPVLRCIHTGHGTQVNRSSYTWVMSHMSIGQKTHESCHTCE